MHSPGLRATFLSSLKPRIKGMALFREWKAGYSGRDFRHDLLAGITVGIIALPLAMALAIASGVPPQYGLYTSIIAGAVTALLGGSSVNVSGPTAAFVVLLVPVSAQFGLGGLVLASVMAGTILIIMGLFRFGRLIQFIPHPVVTGFTSGIAVVIATLQIKDFLGLEIAQFPAHYIEKVLVLAEAMPSIHWPDAAAGGLTLAVLILLARIRLPIPPALVATVVGAVFAVIIERSVPGVDVSTISDRFSYIHNGETHQGVPSIFPVPQWPWLYPGEDGNPIGLKLGIIRALIMPATTIALLGAIESLLCAVAADGLTGKRHDPDAELFALGVGNFVAPLFGGFAATGAIARTAANIRAGARSPIASIVHALFLLAAMVLIAPLLGYLPMASLAALLLMVAWNMSDLRHFSRILRIAPRSDVAVLLTCFSLTVIFDMVISVTVGVVLAALLFMRRMAEMTETRIYTEKHELGDVRLPEGTLAYEIAGPMFFGAAEKVFNSIVESRALDSARALIINLRGVPVMDVTGLVALESILAHAEKSRTMVLLASVAPQPERILRKGGVVPTPGKIAFVHDLEQAVMIAEMEQWKNGLADDATDV